MQGRRTRQRAAQRGQAARAHCVRGSELLSAKIVREAGSDEAKLAERARLELPDAFAGHPHVGADLVERVRRAAVQAEAKRHDAPEPRLERRERVDELLRARLVGGQLVRRGSANVLEQVAEQALTVADRSVEADGRLDEREKLAHALFLLLRLGGELRHGRFAVELLGELAPRAEKLADVFGDMEWQPNRPALVDERARDRLANPPRR